MCGIQPTATTSRTWRRRSAWPYSQEAEPDQQQAERPEDGCLVRLEQPEPVQGMVGDGLAVAGVGQPSNTLLLAGFVGGVSGVAQSATQDGSASTVRPEESTMSLVRIQAPGWSTSTVSLRTVPPGPESST
jgi:hypothetical protein